MFNHCLSYFFIYLLIILTILTVDLIAADITRAVKRRCSTAVYVIFLIIYFFIYLSSHYSQNSNCVNLIAADKTRAVEKTQFSTTVVSYFSHYLFFYLFSRYSRAMEKTHCSTTVMCYFSHTSCRLSLDHGRIMPRNMPVAVLFRCTTKLQLQMHFQLSIAPVSVKLTVESFCHISCCFCGDAVRVSCDFQFILLPFFFIPCVR